MKITASNNSVLKKTLFIALWPLLQNWPL